MNGDKDPVASSVQSADDATVAKPPASHGRHDQFVQYSHQMPDETAESAARVLIRGVPVIYGALLGGLIGNIALGLVFGLSVTVALDLRMGERSLFRPVWLPLIATACPFVSRLLRGMAWLLSRLHLRVPAVIRDRHCGA